MKRLMVLLLILGIHTNVQSQLDPYKWRLGVSAGYSNYYGDLSPYPISSINDYANFFRLFNYNKNYIHDYSYALSLERALTASLGLQFSAGKYSISMSDRYINPNHVLQLNAANFSRALNFKTEIMDYGVGLVIKSDNGKILNKNSFIAPYLNLGVGFLTFKVFGDLYHQDGNPYDYASLMSVNDGIYETRLDQLNTELPDGYSTRAFFGQLGLGLRFRISNQLELFAQSDFKLTTTDYLDDVSGLYRAEYDSPEQQYAALPNPQWVDPVRGKPNGQKDWYIYHSAGIKFSFGPRKTAFTASRISPGRYTRDESISSELSHAPEPMDSLTNEVKESGVTNNYITFIQLNSPYNKDSSYYSFKVLEADVSILNWEKQLIGNQQSTDSLNTVLDSLQSARNRIALDTSDNEAVLISLEQNIREVENQLEDALAEKTDIEAGLMGSRQDKELFQTAYLLSLERQGQRDSSAFVNEILELPAAVKKALAYQGPYYTISPDTMVNTAEAASYGLLDSGIPESREQGYRTSANTSTVSTDQDAQLYSAWLQERARNDYLLEELTSYSEPSYRSNPPIYPRGEDKWADYSKNKHSSPPDISYNINDLPGRTRNSSPFIVPVFIPGNNRNERIQQQIIPGRTQENTMLPPQLVVSPNLRLPSDSLLPTVGASGIYRMPQGNLPVDLRERNLESPSSDSLQQLPSPLPINSKVEIYFGNNQRFPEEQELNKLVPLVDILKNNPSAQLTISGFADNTGSLRYNLQLIDERISSVRAFLEKNGVLSQRINVVSGGLIVRGSNRNPSPNDRKVEIWIQEEKSNPSIGEQP